MGRVPCCASDRLLRRPCACPTRQAFGRARGSAGRSAGSGGFDAVAARTADAGQDIDAAPCRQSARASEAKAGEGDGLGRRQPEPLVIVVRLQLCQAGRRSRHRGWARQWRRVDCFRQEVLRRLRSPRSCYGPACIRSCEACEHNLRRSRQGLLWEFRASADGWPKPSGSQRFRQSKREGGRSTASDGMPIGRGWQLLAFSP